MATAQNIRMTREQFVETFADRDSKTLENGGTVHYGSALPRTEIDVMERRPEEYEVAWGWCDEPYRIVFIDLDGRSTITYCEGDISVTFHEDQETFERELLSARECYGQPRNLDRD